MGHSNINLQECSKDKVKSKLMSVKKALWKVESSL